MQVFPPSAPPSQPAAYQPVPSPTTYQPSSNTNYKKLVDDDPSAPPKPMSTIAVTYDLEAGRFEQEMRYGLLVKVYTILLVQLAVTMGVCVLFMENTAIKTFVQQQVWAFYVALFLPFLLILLIFFFLRTFPYNLILLGLLTLCMSYSLGVVCSLTDTYTVVGAAIITASVVVGLTAYVFYSKEDFSGLGAGLFAALWCLIFAALLQFIFPSLMGSWFGTMYAAAGAIIFSLYIIYDTWLLKEKYGPDDYIIAALELYLDIINLFLMILRLLRR
eukprot:gnl/Spiro4/14359_TR7733_c0_g1_i1.p1 gnl/Spiro4/14359_TR7733_c0_g1~~gnl/Spiro4/14359_TR7733_c0_g1_i1.p1  ORF type:complete len:296 (+),score=80.49 gnl/Spiro4/14359_TR7733_c0_g1_i1:67-888(+)